MILALAEHCPLFAAENKHLLHQLLGTVVRRWHVVAAPAPDRFRRLVTSDLWADYGEYIEQSYKTATTAMGGLLRPNDCGGCAPALLVDFCMLPALLIVENATTDGEFFRAVLGVLRPRVISYFNGPYPRIQIENAGGIGEMPKEIRRHGKRYSIARPGGVALPRIVAVADSDATEPGQETADARAVRQAADEAGCAVHILGKRSIENYVPDTALRSYARTRRDRAPAVDVITALPPVARDHYPMKRGLPPSDERPEIYPAEVPAGFGLGDGFIADLLANFTHTLDAQGLRERDPAGELTELLDLLEGNL